MQILDNRLLTAYRYNPVVGRDHAQPAVPCISLQRSGRGHGGYVSPNSTARTCKFRPPQKPLLSISGRFWRR